MVLGGHFALRCYLDYRSTHDLDGWWLRGLSAGQRRDARAVIRLVADEVASAHGLSIETLRDNLASKMDALVARGAPRDFSDVYEVVQAGLATVSELWDHWHAKNPDTPIDRARAQVVKHIESIAARRPLDQVPEHERPAAEALRRWARTDLTAHPDLRGKAGGVSS